MKTLQFEGYSDDTFGEYAVTREDHDNCASGDPMTFKVWSKSADDGLFVVGQYCPGPASGWLIGVARIDGADDDGPGLPDWPMRFTRSTERSYTPALLIEAPDDVTVEYVS